MKFDVNSFWGLLFFLLTAILYTVNQTFSVLLFANFWSEIIFTLLCFAIMTLGIAMMFFDEFWSESFVGFISIFVMVFILNAILLVYDAFNTFRYASTDYFALFKYAIYLKDIPDPIARLFIAIAPALGILLWYAISKDEIKQWYYLPLISLSLFILTIICTASIHVNIFVLT